MTDTKWTPGPWQTVLPTVVADIEGDVAMCAVAGRNQHEARANARLIASAPDLYEALKAIVGEDEPIVISQRTVERARAALAKANGEAQATQEK